MFLLKLLGIGVLVTVGIAMIAFLEEKLVSGPRRRQIAERARQKLAGSGKGDGQKGHIPLPK